MARQLSVKTGVKLDNISNVTRDIQSQLDSVSKRLKVTVGEISFGNMDSVINDLKSKLSEIGKVDILSSTQNQSTKLKSIKGDYEDILANMSSLKTEIMLANGELAKMKVATDSKSNVKTGTLSYQYDEARRAVEKYGWVVKNVEGENVKVFELVSRTFEDNMDKQTKLREQQALEIEKALQKTISDRKKYEDQLDRKTNSQIDKTRTQDYLKNQQELYTKITSLQGEEFGIKTKLISAEGEYKKELENTLSVVQKLKQESQSSISKGNLTSSEFENKVLKEREELTRKLNLEQAKFNTRSDSKFTKELETQNRYLDQQISKLKMYKQSVESRGGGKPETQNSLIKDLDNQINKINELKKANNILGQVEKTRIQESTNALKVQTNELVKYQSSFSNIFKKMTNYALGGSIIYGGIAQVRQGINDIISLDTAMRDLGKVAKATTDELREFPKVANEIAISIGTSTEGVIKATEYYSRLGYSIAEASERAKQATIFANVGDMTAEDSAKSLITVQKGYGLETLEDMKKASDIMNSIGNNFSTSTKGVADALSRSASSLKSANNSLEESVALVVAGNNAIQDPESVGTALKTLSMRLRGMKVELEDGQVPLSKLREQLIAIANVDIMEKDGKSFKSTYEIMKQLSEVYPKLNESQRAWITQQVSGVRQANIMDGLLSNMTDGVKAYETALDSSGSVMQEQERYMNSIQGRMNEFTETLKSVWVDAINTDSVKGAIDVGTGLLNVLGWIVNKFGVVPTVIGGATMALALFNKEIYNTMISGIPVIGNLNAKIKTMGSTVANTIGDRIISSFINMSASMKTATASTAVLATGNVVLTASLKAVEIGAMMAGVALTMGLSLVITALVGVITKLADSLFTTKAELKEFNQESTQTAESLSKTVREAENLQKQIDDVNKKLNSTTDQQEKNKLTEELVGLQRQLSDVLPESTNALDKQGNAISSNTKIIQESIKAKKEEIALNAMDFVKKNEDINRLDKYKEAYKKYNEQIVAFKNGQGYDQEYTQNYNGMAQVKQSIRIEVDKEDLDKSKKELDGFREYYSQLSKQINSMRAGGFTDAEINDVLPNAISDLANYNKALEEMSSKSEDSANATDNLTQSLDELREKSKQTANEMAKVFEDAQKSIEFLGGLINKLDTGKGISAKEIPEIMKSYPELLAYLDNEVLLRQKINELVVEEQDKQRKAYNTMMGDSVEYYNAKIKNNAEAQNQINKTISSLVGTHAEGYKVDLSNYNTLNEAKTAMAKEAVKSIAGVWAEYWDAQAQDFAMANWQHGQVGGNWDDEASKKKMVEYQQIIKMRDNIRKAMAEIDKIGYNPSGINFGSLSDGNNSNNSTQKEVADLDLKISKHKELQDVLEKINNQIAYNESLIKNASDEEKIKLLTKQNELYKQQIKAVENLNKAREKEASGYKGQLSNMGFQFDGNGNISNYTQRLEALQSWANSLSGKAKEEAIKQVKELQEIADLYSDLVNNKLPDGYKQIQDINNNIVSSQKEIADILKKQKDEFIKAEEEKTKKIKDEIQKRKDLMNQQWKQEDYEDKLKSEQDKLNELESSLQTALRTGNTALVESLKRQIAEQQKVLSDTIRDNERENANNKFDKEMEDLDKNLQDKIDNINNKLTDEELLKMVQQGVTDLSGILDNIGSSTKGVNNAFAGISTIIQDEWIGSLDLFEEKLKGLQAITFNSNDLGINAKQSPNQQSSIRDINITMPFTVNGDVNKDTMEDITEAMEDMKEEIIREIDKTLKR